jgi:hypothetical protein
MSSIAVLLQVHSGRIACDGRHRLPRQCPRFTGYGGRGAPLSDKFKRIEDGVDWSDQQPASAHATHAPNAEKQKGFIRR